MPQSRQQVLPLLICLLLVACGGDDPTGPQPGGVPTEGLVAYFPFSSGATDASGNGNTGTLVGGATASGALLLGDNAADAFTAPYSAMDGLADFSISAWLRIDASHQGHFVLSGANALEDNVVGFSYDEVRGAWRFGEANDNFDFPPESSIEDGQWHHVTVTRTATLAQLFIDGAAVGGAIAVIGDTLELDAGGLVFGQDQDTLGGGFESDQAWAGAMDNLRIYDRALSPAEVSSLADEAR